MLLAVSPMPRARTLMTNAVAVTGWLVRDAAHWSRELANLAHSDGFTRRALVVSCGLLGAAVPFETAVPIPDNGDDVVAWAFAMAMAETTDAVPRLLEARNTVTGSLRRSIDNAVMRIRLGYLWTCVE